jgi:hypothetical protein
MMGEEMKVRNILTKKIFKAKWTTNHAASSYGQPVLVLETGEAVDSWAFEIIEDEGKQKKREAKKRT